MHSLFFLFFFLYITESRLSQVSTASSSKKHKGLLCIVLLWILKRAIIERGSKALEEGGRERKRRALYMLEKAPPPLQFFGEKGGGITANYRWNGPSWSIFMMPVVCYSHSTPFPVNYSCVFVFAFHMKSMDEKKNQIFTTLFLVLDPVVRGGLKTYNQVITIHQCKTHIQTQVVTTSLGNTKRNNQSTLMVPSFRYWKYTWKKEGEREITEKTSNCLYFFIFISA